MSDGIVRPYSKGEISKLIPELRKKIDESTKAQDYITADRASNLIKELNDMKRKQADEEYRESVENERREKISEMEEEIRERKEKWEDILEGFQEKKASVLSTMKSDHEAELMKLNELYKEEPPPQFRKQSATLLQLKAMQKAMVSSKRYLDANGILPDIQRLEKEEMEANKKRWNAEVADRIAKCNKKYRQALNSKNIDFKREENKIILTANEDIENLEKTLSIMKTKTSRRRKL